MRRLTVLAAATAVGLTSFAAHARDFQRPDVEALKAAFAKAAEAEQTDAQADGGGAATAAIEVNGSHEAAAPASMTAFSFRPGEGTPAQTKTKLAIEAGEQAEAAPAGIDPTTTASVMQTGAKEAPEQPSKAVALARPGDGTPSASDMKLIAETRKGAAEKAAVLKGAGRYREIVARYASAYGVPVQLAHAVITIESNYRANATGRAGEIGLMQIKPATARMMGYSGPAKGLYNPETNLKFGMKYLAKAHELGGGTTCGAILRYNAGHAARRMNPISAAYCAKVKRYMGSV